MDMVIKYVCLAVFVLIGMCAVKLFFYMRGCPEKTAQNYHDVESFCQGLISGFKKKARHNKNESMLCFSITMSFSLLAPLFVTLGGDSFIFGKIIPSGLSVCVAFGTAWLQLRKPQHLWALYRGCQRKLEDNLYRYKFLVGEYSHGNRDTLLAERCAEIAMEAHNEWLPIMPKGENLNQTNAREN